MFPDAPPPYPCTGEEPVIPIIDLIDDDGNLVNRITGSACFADWYAPQIGCTWREWVRPEEPPADPPEDPPADAPVDPEPDPAP